MNLSEGFSQQDFSNWIEKFLPDFSSDIRNVDIPNGMQGVKNITTLGESALNVRVFVIEIDKDPSGRKIGLAKESFNLIKSYGIPNAIIAYHSPSSSTWRLSLLTSIAMWSEGKIITKLSNPKRQSYVLGTEAKVNTPTKFLIKKDSVSDLNDLKDRFSLEVVNKEFYKEIASCFTKLVGGVRKEGRGTKTYQAQLNLPSIVVGSQTSIEFAVRLIGRVIFAWFLREKIGSSGRALMPNKLLSTGAVKDNDDYYHQILEPIFFEILNKSIKSRKEKYLEEPFSSIPYLNGGLFSPQEDDDFFSYNEGKQAQYNNTVKVPDTWFINFFEVLELYNFTLDENTSFDEELSIDPEMLGRIFENLLAEITPETGESARKNTGSYYTPRVIVDYMIDESLLLYLNQKTNIDENKLRAVISYDLTDDLIHPMDSDEKERITDALGKIKILDPACGSGAFPIGTLQKIVHILQQVDPHGKLWFEKQIRNTSPEVKRVLEREFENKNFDYIRKTGVIRENIYGVDIQPIATEISRLRCFLTLIVDQLIDDSLENRGVEPLPNLDFKFVTANSLIGLPNSASTNQMGLFEDDSGIKELKELRDMFFNAIGTEREQLKLEFVQAQNRMFQRMIQDKRKGYADLTTKLSSWEPFTHKISSWFDSGWMFGIEDGFDIIIANPPYIQLQKNGGELAKLYQDCGYETFAGSGDIYTLFYEKGSQLIKGMGILTFITSNKWMRAAYGEKLRKYFTSKMNPLKLIDFGGYQVFEATVDTNILIAQKNQFKNELQGCTFNKNSHLNNMSDYFRQNAEECNFNLGESWIILGPIEQRIKIKIETKGIPLKHWDINIFRGILTGYNEAFIIDREKRNELIAQDSKSEEIIRPVLKGRDIKRYNYEFADLYAIATFPAKHYDIDDYPAIKDHLLSFGIERLEQTGKEYKINNEKIKSRKKTNNKWFETQDSISYWEDFSKQKIIWGEISDKAKFAIDIKGEFTTEATTFLMTGKSLFYLLGFLNSSLSEYLFAQIGTTTGVGTVRWKKFTIEQLRIPQIAPARQKDYEDAVKDIIEKQSNGINCSEIIARIDKMVYDEYQLSKEEVEFIEKNLV